jgi:hypothetical protein
MAGDRCRQLLLLYVEGVRWALPEANGIPKRASEVKG